MDLFDSVFAPTQLSISDGAMLLRGFALQKETLILNDLKSIVMQSPLHHMVTPSGHTMSVAMTNCGRLGWISDKKGYRYTTLDPSTGLPWQSIPTSFLKLANTAAAQAGYADFVPDACLVNRYLPATRMSLHQDRDEQDFNQPIVSVSLGIPATFLFGGEKRSDKPIKILLQHGDVVVWGGRSRLNYHGIMPLQTTNIQTNGHAVFGVCRINLTFRKAA